MTVPPAEPVTDPAAPAAVPEPAVDWTSGGTKPEREGPRCENPACRQVLMLAGRRFCARCDRAAGRDPWEHAAS